MEFSTKLTAIFSVPLLPCARDYFASSEWSAQSLGFEASRRQVSGFRLVGNRARNCVTRLLIVEVAVCARLEEALDSQIRFDVAQTIVHESLQVHTVPLYLLVTRLETRDAQRRFRPSFRGISVNQRDSATN